MTAKAGDVQIGLLDVGRHARGWPTALDVNNHQGDFGHYGPAKRLGLEGNSRAARTRDRHTASVARADSHRNRGYLILTLNKHAAVFGQLSPQDFHHVRPGRDRITRAEADARSNQTERERFVAVHDNLMTFFALAVYELECLEYVTQRVAVTGVEGGERIVQHARIFAGETFADEAFQFRNIQSEHLGHQPERKNIFALVLGSAADRFNCQSGNGNADVVIFFLPFSLRLDVVRIVKHDAALLQRVDMVLVGVLIKRQQNVGFVSGTEHFARSDADLKDRGATGNSRGGRHEGHDFLFAAPSQPGKNPADGLNTVLRISRDANDGFGNVG